MWCFTLVVISLIASAFGGFVPTRGEQTRLPLREPNVLNDKSYLDGRSTLVAVGPNGLRDDDTTTCTAIFSCADCKTAQVCKPNATGEFTVVDTITCPEATPYCNYASGTCTTVPDATCGETDDFICLQDGNFPDSTDCKTYHVCKNFIAHKFSCIITGQTYNADSETCETSTDCSTFNCATDGVKAANSLYPSYYAYCNKGATVVVDKCNGINQLNVTSQLCEPICSEEGVLQDVEDCTKYYKCSYLYINDSTKFMMRERLNCPANTGFDPSNFICVSLTNYPSCKTSTNSLIL